MVDIRATTNGCQWGRFVRTIVEVEADNGLIGLGEMGGGGESAEATFRGRGDAAGGAERHPRGVLRADEGRAGRPRLGFALRQTNAPYEALKASGRGRIINFASLTSFTALHKVAAYGASKVAVLALTKTLGCEWAKDGIRTNSIVPGVFVTDLNRALLEGTARGRELLQHTPMGRFDGGFLASGVNG